MKYIESEINSRFQKCKLEICEEKTKNVYCKNSKREYYYPIQIFYFLGFTFRPKISKDKEGNFFVNFTPAVKGWINYYGKSRKSAMSAIYDYINNKLIKWARNKYKNLKRRKRYSGQWLRKLYIQNPYLFAHWKVWKWVAE